MTEFEAYTRLCTGKFDRSDFGGVAVEYEDYRAPSQVRVIGVVHRAARALERSLFLQRIR